MPEFEIRIAGSSLAMRFIGENELDAIEAASLHEGLLRDGDELTVYPADEIPSGADGEDAE